MLTDFFALFSDPAITAIFVTALIVGVLVSLCASLLGVTLVLKRYSMIGDGLSHVGYGALAVASALNLAGEYKMEICLPIVIAAAFLLLRLSENTKINSDAAVALVSVSAIAVGTVIFNLTGGTAGDACNSLFGSASLITISKKDVIVSVVLSAVVISLFSVFYNRIFAVTFDEDFAKATGINIKLYNALISLLTAVTIVVGMQLMGSILISGLVIFPALSAMRIADSFKGVTVASAVISVVGFIVGFLLGCIFGIQIGPAVIISDMFLFLVMCAADKINSARSK